MAIIKPSLLAIAGLALLTSEASAQYYNPTTTSGAYGYQPVGGGLDLGFNRGGFNPNVGLGIGSVGAGVGTGIGRNGIGAGVNTGVGPLGVTADGGIGRNGLGVRAASGIGNTGAALEGGLSGGGLGVGANARVLGFGPGASIGLGKKGPGLGASMAFGPLGTLLIGSHRNSYPGAQQTAAHMYPSQSGTYYTPQNYGNASYYKAVPTQYPNYVQSRPVQQQQYYRASACPVNWKC